MGKGDLNPIVSKQLDKGTICTLLNLQGSPLIGKTIAERQIEVIRKGFNYLSQPTNNALYIADEVGLGKTYIALGIASLLRHFSLYPATYQDVIVVPKENLQYKWEKEIKQFIKYNYLVLDNRVKSVIGSPVGSIHSKTRLEPIQTDHPAYHLYRNSQFSFGLSLEEKTGRRDQLEQFSNRLTDPTAQAILENAYEKKYFLAPYKSKLKKLYAYLLSVCNPSIELLIVDEGHNFKGGIGESNEEDASSDRNNVIARFFGLRRATEEDREIFNDFPELLQLVQPKVQKLIVLSATPKTHSLLELKCQLDLFLKKHILSNSKKEEEVEQLIPQFLIRGNMEYKVGGTSYTRNLCREEYRQGGVDRGSNNGLEIKDDEQAIVMGLLQYHTIKHLNGTGGNASFELGMLAGFETFCVDQEKRADIPEYDEVRTRKQSSSQDFNVLNSIINSYKESFDGSPPPHPKQDAQVDAAFKMMVKGEKSLIFVRRVASANELQNRLLNRWEGAVERELKNKWIKQLHSRELQQLLDCYEEQKKNRKLTERIESIFSGVSQKIMAVKGQPDFTAQENIPPHIYVEEAIKTGLYYLYNHYKYINRGQEFYELLCRHASLSIIKTELIEMSLSLLAVEKQQWLPHVLEEKDQDGGDIEGGDEPYFFHAYFKQSHAKSFKKRMGNSDWLEVNFYLLNQHFQIAGYGKEELRNNCSNANKELIKDVQEAFLKSVHKQPFTEYLLIEDEYPSMLLKNTLLTQLLTHYCAAEFKNFIWERTERGEDVFNEIKVLVTIIRSCIRNGSGFLPLFIADKAEGDIAANYFMLLNDEDSLFHLVLKEMRTIINDYALIKAVNFPEGESFRQIETKLYFQTPALGLTGQSTRSKSNVAAQFRMPGFPFVLVTTDVLREGEDLHTYCRNIYHYGIAWNCSDMEQRTGRIDRINSCSHRKLQQQQVMEPANQIHVFFPYIQKTLEVNQVSRLFESMDSFIRTFNDFTLPHKDNAVAYISDIVESVPEAIKTPIHSKFDFENFQGYTEGGEALKAQRCIVVEKEEIEQFLLALQAFLSAEASYYYGPVLDTEGFSIKADMQLVNRNNRRGPLRIMVRNDINPGHFKLEVVAYLFKVSSKAQRFLNTYASLRETSFDLVVVDDLYALSFSEPLQPLHSFKAHEFIQQVKALLEKADEMEESITASDLVVFNV